MLWARTTGDQIHEGNVVFRWWKPVQSLPRYWLLSLPWRAQQVRRRRGGCRGTSATRWRGTGDSWRREPTARSRSLLWRIKYHV